MALTKSIMMFFIMMALCGITMAAVYKVSDSNGWILGAHANDQEYIVHVGDTIVFEYNNTNHNVMEVSHKNYKSCNTKSPIKVYTSGHDEYTFKRVGIYYFVCGFTDHCKGGEKAGFNAIKSSSPPAIPPAEPIPPSAAPQNSVWHQDPSNI